MNRIIYYFLIPLFLFSCAQIKSYPIKNNTISKSGFYYALPKTYLNVAVTLQKIKTSKGVYLDYAECVGIPASYIATIDDKTEYKVKDAVITNNVYLDKSRVYQLDVNQKFLNKSEFSFEYAKNGELNSATISNENQIIPAVITTANIIKDIAGSTSVLGLSNKDLASYCTTLPDFVTKDLSRLGEIQTSINTLLERGPDGLDQTQLEFRLKELKLIRDGILSKFTKTVKTSSVVVNFEVDPSKIVANQPIPLLLFKKDKGFKRLYTNNPHNDDILISDNLPFHSTALTNSDLKVELHLVYLDKLANNTESTKSKKTKQNAESSENSEKLENSEASFYYRLPAQGKFKVMLSGKNIGEATLAVPQEGITLGAPSNLSNITFKLHPGLGSIYSVSGKTGDANFGAIDSLRKTVFTDKNEKTIKELENKIKIRDLKDQLENGTTSTPEEEN